MIYADYNATTPCLGEVIAVMAEALAVPGNPSSRSHAGGRRAAAALERARAQVAGALTAPSVAGSGTVVFTSGATEACNLAIRGVAERLLARRPRFVLTAVEHPAVSEPHRRLQEAGCEVVAVGVDRRGALDLEALARAIDGRTALVSVMAANHETGVLLPVAAAAALAHAHGALLFCDATQAVGRLGPAHWAEADFVACSAHKFYGPLGAGALWLRAGLAIEPQIHGGGQEQGLRGGTPNLPAIIGLGLAAELAAAALPTRQAQLAGLQARLEAQVLAGLPQALVQGAGQPRLAGTSFFTCPGLPRGWLAQLGEIQASGGSACSSAEGKPSAVLLAMGVPAGDAGNSVRISLGRGSTAAEADAIAGALVAGARRLATA